MPSPRTLLTQGFILSKTLTGKDQLLRSEVLAPHSGLMLCFQRQNDRSTPIELFDFAELSLERRSLQSEAWFIADYQPIQRYTAIAHHYQAFCYACNWVRWVRFRLSHVDCEHRQALCRLMARALFAWQQGARADIVYFKVIYLLARYEGLPLQEQWQASLLPEDQKAINCLLRMPVAEQSLAPSQVASYLQALKTWLTGQMGAGPSLL